MSRIRGKNTAPELALRRGLWAAGIRYRLHHPTPGGRADVVLPTAQIALFIDGCFWHGCPEHYVRPRSRNEFWDAKLIENVLRDRRQTLALERVGWHVIRVWEHELVENPSLVVAGLLAALKSRCHSYRLRWRVVRVEIVTADGAIERRHLEDLRRSHRTATEVRPRSTRKLGRVRGSFVVSAPRQPTAPGAGDQRRRRTPTS
jgi:DNA mismatch endonuclease (patch repair protein)